ncbi:MAG TPA: hypothetical protein DC057_02435 [Spirochaetia bacterium]|nr:hypothetical protein [Spirochaetia bacterium]
MEVINITLSVNYEGGSVADIAERLYLILLSNKSLKIDKVSVNGKGIGLPFYDALSRHDEINLELTSMDKVIDRF